MLNSIEGNWIYIIDMFEYIFAIHIFPTEKTQAVETFPNKTYCLLSCIVNAMTADGVAL